MLQDRAHTSPRLSSSTERSGLFFPLLPLHIPHLSCTEYVWGEGMTTAVLLYIDTKCAPPSTHLLLLCPGELAEHRSLAVSLGLGDASKLAGWVTGTSLAAPMEPPSRHRWRTVSTDNGCGLHLLAARRLPLHVMLLHLCSGNATLLELSKRLVDDRRTTDVE